MISRKMNEDRASWPDIDVSRWAATKRSLHLYLQMLGKIKLAVAPLQPNWLFTALHLSPRGVTTGTIPWRGSSFDATIDVFDSEIALSRSDGARAKVPLLPVLTVAEVYSRLTDALATLGVDCTISTIPQELPDTTPLDEDRRASEYDAAAVRHWFVSATAVSGVFDGWRSQFFGRCGVQVWWGALDVALMLFNGRHVVPPADRGYLMKYDLDAELLNVGLYYGDEKTAPFFYGYIYPEPAEAPSLPIAPAQAAWSSDLREWVVPYEAVRRSPDPPAALRAFIDSIYEQCFAVAGWDRAALSYDPPHPKSRP
ncbi:MAG: DUF5996 family protein [Candidatus Cybelea sp.]